jgi:hypothetical protein
MVSKDSLPFTSDSLRLLLGRVLSKRQTMPGDAEIDRLVDVLNFWKNYYASVDDADQTNEWLQQEEAALETLAIVLPKLKTKIRTELDFFRVAKWNGEIVAAKEKRLRELETLSDAVTTSMQAKFWTRFWEQQNIAGDNRRWREIQDVLCQDFVAAMKPANPEAMFGLSEGGALARWIAAVTPLITGERVKVSSVGQHRKKAARRA